MGEKSGYYVRVKREGKWQPIDLLGLTETEFRLWLAEFLGLHRVLDEGG